MKILLTTGIYPPQIGGPAQYAENLAEEFIKKSHSVRVLHYGLENKLPTGLRHLLFFFRVLFNLGGVDFILALDTFSVGLPTVLAAKIFGKRVIIRVAGDFLWESYVERTGDLVLLKNFYNLSHQKWSRKERIIFRLIKWELKMATTVVFSTDWQRQIFAQPYNLDLNKTKIIENYYG